jgi:hypothetical protein
LFSLVRRPAFGSIPLVAPRDERRVIVWLAVLGPALVATGYALSLLPPIYRETNFWTSSPTFFVLRVGVLIAAIPIAYAWTAAVPGRSPDSGAWHRLVLRLLDSRRDGLRVSDVADPPATHLRAGARRFALFTGFLYGLVKLKDRMLTAGRRTSGQSSR